MTDKICDSIKLNAQKNPTKVAVVFEGKALRYKELWEEIEKYSNYFSKNIKPRSRIGIFLSNSIEYIYSIFGIIHSGMIAVPVDVNLHIDTIRYIINDTDCQAIISAHKFVGMLGDVIRPQVHSATFNLYLTTISNFPDIEQSSGLSANQADVDSVNEKTVLIMYTTGTTGLKKGVELTEKNLNAATRNIIEFMQMHEGIIESLPMPLTHSFGFARLRIILHLCGTVILENGLIRPEKVIYNMKKYNVNSFASVPAGFSIIFSRYLEDFKMISENLKFIEIGSAFMRPDHKHLLMEITKNCRICMHYGLTEASRVAFIEFNESADHISSLGSASPNVEIKIFDESKNILPNNIIGEIAVKGDIVMKGYWRKPEKSQSILNAGFIFTGDIGYIDDLGYLYLSGRKEEIINLGGLKVAPGEIENVLLKYPGIIEAAVIGETELNNPTYQQIVAFIVIKINKEEFNIDSLLAFCYEKLEHFKVPSKINIVEDLPKTTSGKIQKHLLKRKHNGAS